MQVLEYQCKEQQEVSDRKLVEQAISGHQASFETLIDRYRSSLTYLISHYLPGDEASDILQQVFVKLYISLPTITVKESIKPWLMRVALNQCLDELRTPRKRKCIHFSELESNCDDEDISHLAFIPDPGPSPEEIVEQHELLHRLQSVIQVLPSKIRSAAHLRYIDQFTYREIGQQLHISEILARTYCHRAKPHLRLALVDLKHVKIASDSLISLKNLMR